MDYLLFVDLLLFSHFLALKSYYLQIRFLRIVSLNTLLLYLECLHNKLAAAVSGYTNLEPSLLLPFTVNRSHYALSV